MSTNALYTFRLFRAHTGMTRLLVRYCSALDQWLRVGGVLLTSSEIAFLFLVVVACMLYVTFMHSHLCFFQLLSCGSREMLLICKLDEPDHQQVAYAPRRVEFTSHQLSPGVYLILHPLRTVVNQAVSVLLSATYMGTHLLALACGPRPPTVISMRQFGAVLQYLT